MSRYQDLRIGGQNVRKHVRDIAKGAVPLSLAPELSRPGAQPLRIFESGAGAAFLSRQLADQGHKVVISNDRLQGIPGVEEVEADLNRALPFADGRFDEVLCRKVIEHVESAPHTLGSSPRLDCSTERTSLFRPCVWPPTSPLLPPHRDTQ